MSLDFPFSCLKCIRGCCVNFALYKCFYSISVPIPISVPIFIRDGSVSKMCTSGGRQCKTVPILELRVLVHPNQTWIFPLNNIAIKVPKWTKYERNLYNFFRFLVCSQYFKFSFHFMCCQARFRL